MTKSPDTGSRARLRSRSAWSTDSTAARVSTVDSPCTSTNGLPATGVAARGPELSMGFRRSTASPSATSMFASMKLGTAH
eukprot:CAMPEP_0198691682 /NCGR_PEP_ID=MMETSP1468-20131203/209879_1 /TAXON_ID=1461545 /ORGANISM="Mantoniella sp, Strain CCMP1436" /LENGTH=79 /DNA_ID=CAMNT_0044445089 /DNA_START=38 /DNA_END=274 /DNA_ORIENTATION=-